MVADGTFFPFKLRKTSGGEDNAQREKPRGARRRAPRRAAARNQCRERSRETAPEIGAGRAQSPGEVAKEVRKRLATIARSRSFVDWQGIKLLANGKTSGSRFSKRSGVLMTPKLSVGAASSARCRPAPSGAYLKRLPDFDDVTAEQKALDYAQRSRNLLQALSFLISWPAPDRAADLVLKRSGEGAPPHQPTSKRPTGRPMQQHGNS
jgi:hypothetical protein